MIGGGGKTYSTRGFQRVSLLSCVILLSLSSAVNAQDNNYESAYTLTKVDSKGENTITKFEWDETQNRLVPAYYRIEIKELISDSYDKVYENYTETPVIIPEGSSAAIADTLFKNNSNGAVYNASNNGGTITELNADFVDNAIIKNNLTADWNFAEGGAVNSYPNIDNINGNFIGNYIEASSDSQRIDADGGAFYGNASNIRGHFVNNYIKLTSNTGSLYGEGGAIRFSMADNANIVGDFIGNFVELESASEGQVVAYGGAVWGSSVTVTGDFINNHVLAINHSESKGSTWAEAGALYGGGNITGNFIGNYAKSITNSTYASAHAGALAGGGTIKGDFIGNFAEAISENDSAGAYGGAVYITSNTNNITGNFFNNYAKAEGATTNVYAYGGAISTNWLNNSNSMSGLFIGNHVESSYASYGGAVDTKIRDGATLNIEADFINNYAEADMYAKGGAISIEGQKLQKPIQNMSKYSIVKQEVVNQDGSVYKTLYSVCDASGKQISTAEFEQAVEANKVAGLTDNGTSSYSITKEEYDYILQIYGEDYIKSVAYMENPKDIFTITITAPEQLDINTVREQHAHLVIKNSNLTGNYTEAPDAKGGALYSEDATVKILTDNGKTTYISGNYAKIGDTIDENAIYLDKGELIFDVQNGSSIVLNDNVNGINYSTYIIGDKDSTFVLNNSIKNAEQVNLIDTNLVMTKENWLNGNDLYLHSGTVNLINNTVGTMTPEILGISGDTNILVDVDLANETMDKISANDYAAHNGNLIVSGMNLLSDSKGDKTEIFFAEQGLKDNVLNGTGELPDKYQTAYTPIYKYKVNYDNRDDGGYFVFDRFGGGNSSESYNPSVLATPVTTQAGGQSVVNETVRFAFQHMDMFSQMPLSARIAYINKNRYAISEGVPQYNSELEYLDKGYWVKPFTSFEKINLNHGPDVDAITYGTLVGFDGKFRELKHGWYNVQSIYGGYTGSQMSYSGVDTSFNGGIAGLTETFYKGNFFTALTATAGGGAGTSSTMYGNEDYTMLMGGIGSKSGYNFEFKDGKYILQPIMFMNYSFVNTFDYTNAAGVRIKSDPLHTFQLNPQMKFIANLQNGWQPYASVGVVWNVLNVSKVRANEVILPKMSVDPYVEYGVGLQRNWKDRFTGFAQAMVRNGGRNGVALTFGFRWAIGKGDDL